MGPLRILKPLLAAVALLVPVVVTVPTDAQEPSPVVGDGASPEGDAAETTTPEAVRQAAGDYVVVEGLGNGHGRGMGQWGAYGYAVDHGWSYRQILDHFYGGSHAGSVPDQLVTVHLTRYDGTIPVIHAAEPFTIEGIRFVPGQYARVRVVGEGTFGIDVGPSCAGPWTAVVASLSGVPVPGPAGSNRVIEAHPSRFNYGNDVSGLLAVCHDERAFRGALRVVEHGAPALVDVLPLEQYLRGVVPRESPASWGSAPSGRGFDRGMNALQAQAVAARSFVLSLGALRRARGTFIVDTCDSQSCQVYSGAWYAGVSLESGPTYDTTNHAIASTAGEVRVLNSNGQIAVTEFSSSTGGYTSRRSEGNGFNDVPDLGDATAANPHHPWQVQIHRSAIQAAYPQIGTLVNIAVTKRNGLGEWGGRVQRIQIDGTAGRVILDIPNWGGDVFRTRFGLRSDWYNFIQQASPPLPPPGPARQGFWTVKPNGAVDGFGGALFHGDTRPVRLNQPIVGIASTPSGNGYWLVSSDGGVFTFGDARFFGSTGAMRLNRPIVGIASTPSGNGYWLVASDGGVFTFGDARFFGSTGAMRLNRPVIGMAPTVSGGGYWLVGSDGGIFTFGNAPFAGSLGSNPPPSGVTGVAPSSSGNGYLMVDRVGRVYRFGDAVHHGDRAGRANRGAIVDISMGAPGVSGYYLLTDQAVSYPFGSVTDYPSSVVGGPVVGMAALGTYG